MDKEREQMDADMDEFCATHHYVGNVKDWRKVPETEPERTGLKGPPQPVKLDRLPALLRKK